MAGEGNNKRTTSRSGSHLLASRLRSASQIAERSFKRKRSGGERATEAEEKPAGRGWLEELDNSAERSNDDGPAMGRTNRAYPPIDESERRASETTPVSNDPVAPPPPPPPAGQGRPDAPTPSGETAVSQALQERGESDDELFDPLADMDGPDARPDFDKILDGACEGGPAQAAWLARADTGVDIFARMARLAGLRSPRVEAAVRRTMERATQLLKNQPERAVQVEMGTKFKLYCKRFTTREDVFLLAMVGPKEELSVDSLNAAIAYLYTRL